VSPPPAPPSPPLDEPLYQVARADGELMDNSRDRRVPYRVFAPVDLEGQIPVIVISHGGFGSNDGFTRGNHLGTTFAGGGFVAIHVGHLPSTPRDGQLDDRPADVTFLLDELEAEAVVLPAGFAGTPDLGRVGHTGHSYGAYTSHALAGAEYARNHLDPRVDAIAPISPQGAGQFGGFDNGPDDNTWASVSIPAYNLVGSDEINTNARGTFIADQWRLTPFARYPGTADTFLTVIDGQNHSDMWNNGSPDVKAFIAGNILRFMLSYVANDPAADPCTIGDNGTLADTTRRPSTANSKIGSCPA